MLQKTQEIKTLTPRMEARKKQTHDPMINKVVSRYYHLNVQQNKTSITVIIYLISLVI